MVRYRTFQLRSELVRLRVTEAELEQMHDHVRQQDNPRDGHVQRARGNGLLDVEIRSALQSDEDVQEGRKQNVLLNDVRVQAEARPVQADVEITVPVEVIWPEEEVEVADRMDDHEEDQEKCRPRHSFALALDLVSQSKSKRSGSRCTGR